LFKHLLRVAHPLGSLLLAFGLAALPPILVAAFDRQDVWAAFAATLALALALALALRRLGQRARRELRTRDGYLLVVAAWIVFAAVAALPLWLALPGLSYTRAYFEAMSGLTTTGATVLSGLDFLPRAVNLWRSELAWLGGLGIIGLGMAVLPLLGTGGMQVYRAESTGPIKESKLTPRVKQTARSLGMIYCVLTAACALALRGAGMSWFDAICHAMSALSLTAFSTHDRSIAWFQAPLVEAVLVVFMLLAAINFATHYLAWRERSLRVYLRDPEARALLSLVLGSCLLGALYLRLAGTYGDYWTALRYVGFNLVSLAIDCGFFSADYGQWPLAVALWMLLLSCLAASAGSTGGGIKMIRTQVLFKHSARELYGLVHPAAVHTLKLGGQAVSERTVLSVFSFIHLYTITVVGLSLLLVASGMDFLSGFSAVVAAVNNLGPGLGAVGPASNYAALSEFQIWVCTVAMLAGRLELFILLVPLAPAFWRD
jgi:trk system potassium uptake protein TrkH